MTVESYEKWKKGEHINKAKSVIDFYKTNPTMEQERLRSEQLVIVGFACAIVGVVMGFGIGFCFSMLL